MNLAKRFGERMRARREKRGWTLRELGERLDVSPPYLVKVEQGRANLTFAQAERIADVLGSSPFSMLR